MHAFFGFHRLVQAIGPTPPRHQSAGKFVNDNHLPVLDNVVDITLEDRMRFKSLLHMMQCVDLSWIVEIVNTEQSLNLGDAAFGQSDRTALFVHGVITLGVNGSALLLRWIALNDRAAL